MNGFQTLRLRVRGVPDAPRQADERRPARTREAYIFGCIAPPFIVSKCMVFAIVGFLCME